jgi:hypothetical protein
MNFRLDASFSLLATSDAPQVVELRLHRPQLPQAGAIRCAIIITFAQRKLTLINLKSDRAELRRVVSRLSEGDVLTVTRLDRLARSTRDLLNTWGGRPN